MPDPTIKRRTTKEERTTEDEQELTLCSVLLSKSGKSLAKQRRKTWRQRSTNGRRRSPKLSWHTMRAQRSCHQPRRSRCGSRSRYGRTLVNCEYFQSRMMLWPGERALVENDEETGLILALSLSFSCRCFRPWHCGRDVRG